MNIDINMDIETFIQEYVKVASKHFTYYSTQHKNFSSNARKLSKLLEILKETEEFSKNVIDRLISHDNVGVATFICTRALELDYKKEEAKKRLQDFINDEKIGSFRAIVWLELVKSNMKRR